MTDLLADDHPALEASSDLAAARTVLASAVIDADSERHRRFILDFIDEHDDALHRSCRTGHLTASGLVLSADGSHVVLLFHKKLQRWLQPGGHCDGDANLAAVALKEASEETGIPGLQVLPEPIDIDVHEVDPPKEGPHLHLDVRYLVVAPPGAQPVGNEESTDIVWAPVDDLERYDLDAGTHRMLVRGRAVLAAHAAA